MNEVLKKYSALAVVDPVTPRTSSERRSTATNEPRSHPAQCGGKSQPPPFEKPKDQHNCSGSDEGPQPGMDQKEHGRGKGARIEKEKARWFLRITPMKIHDTKT